VAYRVGLATLGALMGFIADAAIEKLLFPRVSIVGVHGITIVAVAALTFFVQRYAVTPHHDAVLDTKPQPVMSEDANRLLLPLLATMREGILIVNSRLDVILYNDAATDIVRLPIEEGRQEAGAQPNELSRSGLVLASSSRVESVRGEGSSKLVSQRPRLIDATRDPAINDTFRRVLDKRKAVEIRVELIGRTPRTYHLRVTPLDDDFAAGVFFDITELEHLERVRREFFANLSHELRTPLTAILAYAETLEAGGFDDTQNSKRFVEKLHKHANRMSKLIADISDLSAIESGKIHLALEPVRLSGIVADMIALTEARLQVRPRSAVPRFH
jgi:two-component system, OmpR family, phosphate regulon sensor histidine kinase PhoR